MVFMFGIDRTDELGDITAMFRKGPYQNNSNMNFIDKFKKKT